MVVFGTKLTVEPTLLLFENAKAGKRGSRRSFCTYYVQPALAQHQSRTSRQLAQNFVEWDNLEHIQIVRTFEATPSRRNRSHRRLQSAHAGATSTSSLATLESEPDIADGNPDCSCDQPGRCRVHDH